MDEIESIYKNIVILKNEKNEPEFGFENIDVAKSLWEISMKNGILDSCNEDKLCMQFLADILTEANKFQVLEDNSLHELSEQDVIHKLKNSKNKNIRDAWEKYENLEEVYTSREKVEGKYNINMQVKKRYVDPLVKTKEGIYRLSKLLPEVEKEIQVFKESNTNEYVWIDHDIKGHLV